MRRFGQFVILLLFFFAVVLALPPEASSQQKVKPKKAAVKQSAVSLPVATGSRIALVIGNSTYDSSPLRNPVNDATDMAAILRETGFTVIIKKNADLKTMEEALEEFGKSLKRSEIGLFFYAGHGLQIGGANYLIPIGAKIDKESDVKYAALDTGKVLDEMADANNGLNIVILDACRDNPLSRRFRSASRGLAVISNAPLGSFISYSTSPGQVAYDGEGRNSPYTAALVEYIKTPGLRIEDIFKNVRYRLSKSTEGKQIPWELSSLQGDFYFRPVSDAPTVSVPTGISREDKQRLEQEKQKLEEGKKQLEEEKQKLEEQRLAMAKRPPERPAAPSTFTDPVTGMEFVFVKGGCYDMGDSFGDGDSDEKPVHNVCVNDFSIGKYEVTQGQWKAVMGNNPSYFSSCGDNCPVENVSWNDVQDFIQKLNAKTGKSYRLPTEAEWEYAARSGGKREKFAGFSSESDLSAYAWYTNNSGSRTHPVGEKKPNGLGLYDMTGNVWEWCSDWFSNTYYQSSPRDNPQGPSSGSSRVLRGGSWLNYPWLVRASGRFRFVPSDRFYGIGFRLVSSPR